MKKNRLFMKMEHTIMLYSNNNWSITWKHGCTVFSILISSTQENVGKISFATDFVQYLISVIDVLDAVLVYRGFCTFWDHSCVQISWKIFFTFDLFYHWWLFRYVVLRRIFLPRWVLQFREMCICLKNWLMSTLFQHYTWMNPVLYP